MPLITNLSAIIVSEWCTVNLPKELIQCIAEYFAVIAIFSKIVNKDSLLSLIKIAFSADRFDDMMEMILIYFKYFSNNTINNDNFEIFNVEERRLLFISFKKCVGNLIDSQNKIEALSSITIQTTNATKEYLKIIDIKLLNGLQAFMHLIENNLIDHCKKILFTKYDLKTAKIPSNFEEYHPFEELIFYYKFTADCYRILCQKSIKNDIYQKQCSLYYEKAMEYAQKTLNPLNETKLALLYNYTIYLDKICGKPMEAFVFASKSFEQCIESYSMQDDAIHLGTPQYNPVIDMQRLKDICAELGDRD